MNPNSLLFSERVRESSKSSHEGGGAMVLGKLLVPGRPTNLDNILSTFKNATPRFLNITFSTFKINI